MFSSQFGGLGLVHWSKLPFRGEWKSRNSDFKNVAGQLHPPPRASHESDVLLFLGWTWLKRQLVLQILETFLVISDLKNHCSRKYLLMKEEIWSIEVQEGQ